MRNRRMPALPWGPTSPSKRRMRPARRASAWRDSLSAFILRFAGGWRFLLSGPALVSQPLTRPAKLAEQLKDQHMKKRVFVSLASASWFVVMSASHAATFTEDFSANPLQNGWQVFGDTNLFGWNQANQNLEVTWDSTHPNSYFYRPLNVTLTRYDDFTLEFDLRLSDIASGMEPGKTGPLQIGFGLLNLAGATSTNFMRGAYGGAPMWWSSIITLMVTMRTAVSFTPPRPARCHRSSRELT